MTKSSRRRTLILDQLADYVLREGLNASSLRALAKAARTSDRMLLYYFEDKDELIAATLERIAGRLTQILTDEASATPEPFAIALARLTTLVRDDALWPYMRLWLELASLSARGDPMLGAVGTKIGLGFMSWIEAQLDPPSPDNAAVLFVMIEGAVLLKSIGLDQLATSAIAAFDSVAAVE